MDEFPRLTKTQSITALLLAILLIIFSAFLYGCHDDDDDPTNILPTIELATNGECPAGKVLCKPFDGVGPDRCFSVPPRPPDEIRPSLCEDECGNCLYGCRRHGRR